MRKSRFCAPILGLMVAATPFSGGVPLASAAVPPVSVSVPAATTLPPTQTWDERMQEIIRRVREKLGDMAGNTPVPLKVAAEALRTRFDANGLPSNLTEIDLQEMSADAAELANCAELDPKPPADTSYALVVFLHDLGLALEKAIEQY